MSGFRESIDRWIRLLPPEERMKASLAAASVLSSSLSKEEVLAKVLPGHWKDFVAWRQSSLQVLQLDPNVSARARRLHLRAAYATDKTLLSPVATVQTAPLEQASTTATVRLVGLLNDVDPQGRVGGIAGSLRGALCRRAARLRTLEQATLATTRLAVRTHSQLKEVQSQVAVVYREQPCTLCREPVQSKPEGLAVYACGHVFHAPCRSKAAKEVTGVDVVGLGNECPMCGEGAIRRITAGFGPASSTEAEVALWDTRPK